jgi:MFS transporter, putative metabolite:H+ symporter
MLTGILARRTSTGAVPTPDTGIHSDIPGLTRRHVAVLVACALGFGADLLSVGLGAAAAAVFSSPEHHLASRSLALLLAAPFCGAVLGAPLIGGCLGYRFGPKRSLTWSLWLLALASVCVARTAPIGPLIAFRTLTGVALGGFSPLMFTYLSEVLPAASRGKWTAVVIAIGLLGAPLGIWSVRALEGSTLALEAWRLGFLIGAACAVIAALAFRFVPESPRWLVARGRLIEATSAGEKFARSHAIGRPRGAMAAHLPRPAPRAAPSVGQLLILGGLSFIGPWATSGFPLLVGAVFIAKGYALLQTLSYVGVAALGPTIATLLSAPFFERVARRRAIVATTGAMAISLLIFSLAQAPAIMVVASLTFQIAESLYLTALSIVTPELFTTMRRAAGVSTAWGLNRLAATLAPLTLVPYLSARGPSALLVLLGAACALLFVLSFASPIGRARTAL